MRRPLSLVLLLAGGLLLLVSLYLPWQETSLPSERFREGGGGVLELLDRFGGRLTIDGWSSGVGEAAALFALVLAATAAVALARPNLVGRLPLGHLALFAGYLGLAVGAQARSSASHYEIGMTGIRLDWAYGAYLGIAAAVLVLLAGGARMPSELVQLRSLSRLAVLALSFGLLVAFLLPWLRLPSFPRATVLGVAIPAAVIAAILTLRLLALVWRADPAARLAQLPLSASVALFTGAAVSSVASDGPAYSAWVALGIAVSLPALSLVGGTHVWRFARPPMFALATGAVAGLFITSLFLPWQEWCYAGGNGSGRCISTTGWTSPGGAAAAVLAIMLVVVALAQRRSAVSAAELTVGIAILVATLGFQLTEGDGSDFRVELGYGSTIGFTGAALLVGLAIVRLRPPIFEWNRLAVRLAPLAACAAYVVVVVLPWWDVLPRQLQSALSFAPLSWLTISAAVLGIHLLRLWNRQIVGHQASTDSLVILPLLLLLLAALDLVRIGVGAISWGGGIIVGLCLLLTLLGRLELRDGLENLRVPEILRVDRL